MADLKQKIEDLKQYPLSDSEIQKITGHKLLIYQELYKYDTLEHLLHMNNGSVIIMYLQNTQGSYGHYCCLNKISDREVEFFDPYGLFPDKQLKFTDFNMNKKVKQDHTYLSWLMYNSPYKLSFNHKFQKKSTFSNMWLVVSQRIKNKHLSLKQYKNMIDNGVKQLKQLGLKNANSDDYIVTSLYDDVFPN